MYYFYFIRLTLLQPVIIHLTVHNVSDACKMYLWYTHVHIKIACKLVIHVRTIPLKCSIPRQCLNINRRITYDIYINKQVVSY